MSPTPCRSKNKIRCVWSRLNSVMWWREEEREVRRWMWGTNGTTDTMELLLVPSTIILGNIVGCSKNSRIRSADHIRLDALFVALIWFLAAPGNTYWCVCTREVHTLVSTVKLHLCDDTFVENQGGGIWRVRICNPRVICSFVSRLNRYYSWNSFLPKISSLHILQFKILLAFIWDLYLVDEVCCDDVSMAPVTVVTSMSQISTSG